MRILYGKAKHKLKHPYRPSISKNYINAYTSKLILKYIFYISFQKEYTIFQNIKGIIHICNLSLQIRKLNQI